MSMGRAEVRTAGTAPAQVQRANVATGEAEQRKRVRGMCEGCDLSTSTLLTSPSVQTEHGSRSLVSYSSRVRAATVRRTAGHNGERTEFWLYLRVL